eukprot:sb/3473360/
MFGLLVHNSRTNKNNKTNKTNMRPPPGYLHCEERDGKKYLSVRTAESSTITTLPKSSDVVTCKVSSVNPREVKVQILSVEGKRLPLHFRGAFGCLSVSKGETVTTTHRNVLIKVKNFCRQRDSNLYESTKKSTLAFIFSFFSFFSLFYAKKS